MAEKQGTWKAVRTCSRVSSGPCVDCGEQTYFRAYRNGGEVLCFGCYEIRYEPEKAAEREVSRRKAEEEKKARLILALGGKLPGAVVTENGTILGPPRKVFGIGMREVLREGLYDTEAWATEESGE